MNSEQSYKMHMAIEYMRHRIDCGEEFGWNFEDIESDEIHTILGCYGIVSDDFSSEAIEVLRSELIEIAEKEQDREMGRIYAVEA
jgi:hypothetical protein